MVENKLECLEELTPNQNKLECFYVTGLFSGLYNIQKQDN